MLFTYSFIHSSIHPSIHLFIFFFFFSFETGGGKVWGHSKSCLYRRRIRRPGREGRGIYLFLTSSSLFPHPPLFPFLCCICISIDSFSFFLRTNIPIVSSLKRLAFLPHQLSLHILKAQKYQKSDSWPFEPDIRIILETIIFQRRNLM